MVKPSSPVPTALKAEFQELARRIVRADRAARIGGRSQNTIYAIGKALEGAFKRGRDMEADDGAPESLSWEMVPPRAREALHFLGVFARRDGAERAPRPVRLEREFGPAERPGWLLAESEQSDRRFVSGAIQPLVRLGLLLPVEPGGGMIELSERGMALYDEYQRRRDQHDPTLPLESIRPSRVGG